MVKEVIKLSPVLLLAFFTTINLLIFIDRGVLSSVLTILKNNPDTDIVTSPLINTTDSIPAQTDITSTIPGLGIDESQQGALGSLFMLGFIVSAPIFAHYSQIYHPFYLIAIGMSIWGLASILAATSYSYFQLIVSRALSGVGEASFISLAPPIILDNASDKNKSTWIAIFYSTIALGYAVGYLYGGFTVDLLGSWRWAFGIEGILIIPIILICIFSEKDPKMLAKRKEKKKDKSKGKDPNQILGFITQFKKLYTNALYVFITLGFTAFIFTVGAYGYWIPTIFKQLFDTTEEFGNILSGILTLICGVVGTLLGAFILDLLIKELVDVKGLKESKKQKLLKHKYTQYSTIFLTVTTLIGAVVGIIGTASKNFWGFTIGFAVGEFCIFLSKGPVAIALMNCVPDQLRGQANALAIFFMHLLGDFPSPYIIGWIFEKSGYYEGTLFISIWLLWAVFFWAIAANASRFEKPSFGVVFANFFSPAPKKDEKKKGLLGF